MACYVKDKLKTFFLVVDYTQYHHILQSRKKNVINKFRSKTSHFIYRTCSIM